MKKIYCFHLYGEIHELTNDNYPGIDGLDIITGNNFCYVLYAWTPNKNIRKSFKQQRDMDKFKEIIHEIPEEEFDKFSDKYSDTFLEEQRITTKYMSENNIISIKTVKILTTSNELNMMLENYISFMRKQLENVISSNIIIRENYFSGKYKKMLEFFLFEDIISYAFPIDGDSPPFNSLTDDNLAIYSHLYCNTYRKDII